MNGSQLPTNQLHDINWGALDHAFCAPQSMTTLCTYTGTHHERTRVHIVHTSIAHRVYLFTEIQMLFTKYPITFGHNDDLQ